MVVTGEDIADADEPLPPASASAEGGGSDRRARPPALGAVDRAASATSARRWRPSWPTPTTLPHDGVDAVEVDWEPLPAVTDVFAAMADGAPQLSPTRRRTSSTQSQIKAGDPDAAFARAQRVVKQRMVSQRLSGVADGAARRAWPRPTPTTRRHRRVGHAPGAPRPARRPRQRPAACDAEPDPRDQPRHGRRLRREVRLLPGGRGAGRARPPATACRSAGWRRASSTWWRPPTAAPRWPTWRPPWRTTAPSPRSACR